MRRLVNAARLPDRMLSTIRQVLETDEEFRLQVAELADEALLGRLAQLWLARPEGWEAELAELLESYEGDRRRLDEERDARLTRERIATLERNVARSDAELVVLRKASGEGAAALEAERQATRRAESRRRALAESFESIQIESQRLSRERHELEGRVDDLAHQLDLARRTEATRSGERDAARAEVAHLVGELTRTRSELAALQAELDSTRRSAAEALADVAEAGRRLDVSVRRAAGVIHLTAAPAPPGPAPGTEDEPVAPAVLRGPASPAPPKRSPVRLPPGTFADEPEAAEYLVRSKGMTLAVDGYNVSISSWPGRDLPDQRWRLVHALAELVARFDLTVRLYFDGVDSGSRLQPPAVARRRLSVEFSPSTVEADDKIIALADDLDPTRPITVATNDGRVRREVSRSGANVISVEQLLWVLRRFPDAAE